MIDKNKVFLNEGYRIIPMHIFKSNRSGSAQLKKKEQSQNREGNSIKRLFKRKQKKFDPKV